MKKKILSMVFIMTLLLTSVGINVFAAGTVTLSNIPDINKGDTVTVSGSTTLDEVTVKVTRPDNTILYVNVLQGPVFADSFKMPGDAALGIYKVVVGQGGIYDTKSFEVKQVTETGNENEPTKNTNSTAPEADNSKTRITSNDKKVAVSTSANLTAGSDGVATASISQSQISTAVNQAITQAEKQGNGKKAEIIIEAEAAGNVDKVRVGLAKESLGLLAGGNIDALTISTPVASIKFDKNSLSTIYGQAKAEIKVSVSRVDVSGLSEKVSAVIEDRPVFNFSVTSGDRSISQFGGRLNISVPYTPKPGEDINSIIIYYIDEKGELKTITSSVYDEANRTVKFQTDHFSEYAVGYKKVNFKDVPENASFAKAVSFISARGIASGVGNNKFAPGNRITRAQFIFMMMRAYGISPDTTSADNFADAGNTYYTGYLAVVKQKGISKGIGNNKFAPDNAITRQEMVTLLYNTLKAIDKLPEAEGVKNLKDFSDSGLIASWAKEAFELFVNAGVISGSEGKLNATVKVDRAQMAQVLFDLLAK